MSVSRSLNLVLKLNGAAQFKSSLVNLQNEATKLQKILSGININIGEGKGIGGIEGPKKAIGDQIDGVIETIKTKGAAVKGQLSEVYKMGPLGGIANYVNNKDKVKSIKQLPNVNPIATLAAAEEAKIVALKAQQLEQGKQMAAQFHKMNNDRISNINTIYKAEEEKMRYIQQRAKQLFQTGFGLHIVQMYIAPVVYVLEQITAKMISVFSEFDKKFTSYMVKSEAYGENLSQSDFYKASVGQTYGITDAATAAERFAASGVDVAKSQEALTAVMQVATSAEMGYADAANGVIKTMQAMHMEVQDTTVITDALINSANASTAELQDLVGWFEYAASSAYAAGLNVQELSAYLGILASSGTPNTGAAMRQLFLQTSKEDIQKSLMGSFDWIKQEDFANMDQLILKMRKYVQASSDQKAATLSITRLLGGKANAQQALNNLLMAEPELWNQVTSAVGKTGSTADLYNKITDNTADSIARIKVNFEILMSQLGQSVGPILKVIASGFTALTNAFISLPGFVKSFIGILIIAATVFTALLFVVIGVVGALSIMNGTLLQLNITQLRNVFTTTMWKTQLKTLITQIFGANAASLSFTKGLKGVNLEMITAIRSAKTYSAAQNATVGLMIAGAGAMLGYSWASSAMQKQMYGEAKTVSLLTSAWIAFGIARAGAFNPLAIAGGLAAGAGYEALMYSKIETMQRDAKLSEMATKVGIGGGSTNKTFNISNINANITSEGLNIDDLLDAYGDDGE